MAHRQRRASSTAPAMTSAERAAKLIAAFEDAPARPLSQITMSVDAGNGTTDRVQLAMRGSSLNATIDAADPRAAQTMTARSDELVRALSRGRHRARVVARPRGRRNRDDAGGRVATELAELEHELALRARERLAAQQDRQRSQDDRRQQQRDQRGGQQQ